MRKTIVLGCMMAAGLALAGTVAMATGERTGRYSMSPAEGGGFVRLDTETGQMSLCQRRDSEWSCRDMAEPNRGLADEVERLRADNQRLRAEIRQMEDIMLGEKGSGEAGPRGGRGRAELKLPTEQDIDSIFDYGQRMLRKFRERMKEIEGADRKGTPL